MSEENREGVAYLLALKQSSQADAASAPAGNAEADSPDVGEGRFHGSNRR